MKKIIIASLFFVLISCQEKGMEAVKTVAGDSEKSLFFPESYSKDTLYFDIRIDECGEWGGPKEEFVVYIDSLNRFQLNYKRYKFNCDSIDYYKDKVLESKKTVVLTEDKKEILSAFLTNLMKAKIEEKVDSNAGSIFHVFKNDSTLTLGIHSTNRDIEENYYQFKRGLGFAENRRKENTAPVSILEN